MTPKTRALAAFTRYGSWAPPAPRLLIAFHRPGARKPTPPITKALKSVVRYHVRFRTCCCPVAAPSAGGAAAAAADLVLMLSLVNSRYAAYSSLGTVDLLYAPSA